MTDNNLNKKINEFTQAMQKYEQGRYKHFEVLVSFSIVSLQTGSLFHLIYTFQINACFYVVLAMIVAYFAADFVNGLVHMIMDNNTHYTAIGGPYVAAFHLHHAKYTYQERPVWKVYFDESGTKFWLLAYLFCLVGLQYTLELNSTLNTGLTAFGIFSSLAELSHYWCHNATDKNEFLSWLQKKRFLLSKIYHTKHHRLDNIQYAFLNGATDPLINLIARVWCKGYKNYADKHTQAYLQLMRQSKSK